MTARRTTETDYRRRILAAQIVIQDHLDEAIDPARLARAASFSLHHFHRIFRALVGESVMEHVRRLRLERAARKLRGGDARIVDLALEAGYDSHEAFTRAFAARFGEPPSAYREHPDARLEEWRAAAASLPEAPVRVATLPAVRIVFMRASGSYARVGETWQALRAWARAQGLLDGGLGPPPGGATSRLYGVCPDDPEVTPEELLRFDAGVAVGPEAAFADAAVGVQEIPAGRYAIGLHRGPYHRLHWTYLDVIGRWFPTSGEEPAPEPVVEHYLNDPSSAAPDDLLTEVRVRIAG